jgi:hypothetical protein
MGPQGALQTGGGVRLKGWAETFLKTSYASRAATFAWAGLIRLAGCGGTRIVFFLLLRISQRWQGHAQSATLLVNT